MKLLIVEIPFRDWKPMIRCYPNLICEQNNIQNNDTSSNIILENTGSGYVQFGGTGGIAIPAGNESSRPINPEVGDFRFNRKFLCVKVDI